MSLLRRLKKKLNPDIKDKDNKELVKNSASAFVLKIAGLGFNYIFTFLIARIYGATGSGIYSLFQTVLQFFVNLGKFGFDTAIMRFTAQYKTQGQLSQLKDLYVKTLKFTVASSLVFSLVLFFGADKIGEWVFHKPQLGSYFKIAAFAVLPLVLLGIHADCLRGYKKVAAFAFLNNVSTLIISSIILAISWFVYKESHLPVLAYSIGIFITSVMSIFWWLKESNIQKIKITDTVLFNEKFAVAFTLFSASILQMVRGWADTIIIGRYLTEADVGVYKVAFRVATITSLTLTSILISVAPKIAELYSKNDLKKMAALTQNSTKIIFWTSVPVLILFLILPKFIMGLYGPEFEAGSSVLVFLTLGQFVNAATGPVSNVLNMTGKQKINRNVVLFSTIITISLNVFFIPVYGIQAAAIINAIGYVLFNIIPMFIVKYYYGFFTFDVRHVFSFRKKDILK